MALVELGSILHFEKGKKPILQSDSPDDGFLPYVDIEAFETGKIKQYTDGTKCTPCDDGDILIVCDGSRWFGWTCSKGVCWLYAGKNICRLLI